MAVDQILCPACNKPGIYDVLFCDPENWFFYCQHCHSRFYNPSIHLSSNPSWSDDLGLVDNIIWKMESRRKKSYTYDDVKKKSYAYTEPRPSNPFIDRDQLDALRYATMGYDEVEKEMKRAAEDIIRKVMKI